jgi:Zn finger protein HypA/HybF involved in hydrogenase expression
MGETFEFKCPDCGYRAEVSGGEDCGMIAVTETMVCEKCRNVVDVMVGYAIPSLHDKPDKDMGRCPKCYSDEVMPWGTGRPCPKCSGKMVKGGRVALWD